MRLVNALFAVFFLVGVVAAQTPAPNRGRTPSSKPVGDLAQVMRAINFPNSNIIFDVQTNDPGIEKVIGQAGGGALATFANLYSGWQQVEYAGVALAGVADLIMESGRLCGNGKPVPLNRPDFIQFAQKLRAVGSAVEQAAKEKDREKVIKLTDQVADACVSCHDVYRNGMPGTPDRCVDVKGERKRAAASKRP